MRGSSHMGMLPLPQGPRHRIAGDIVAPEYQLKVAPELASRGDG